MSLLNTPGNSGQAGADFFWLGRGEFFRFSIAFGWPCDVNDGQFAMKDLRQHNAITHRAIACIGEIVRDKDLLFSLFLYPGIFFFDLLFHLAKVRKWVE
jgi:hypothetical protein